MPEPNIHDRGSEQALLKAMLLEGNIYKQMDLSIDDFYESKHQKIYQIIIELSEEGMEVNYVSVYAKVKAHGWEKEIEPQFLSSLGEHVPDAVTTQWRGYVSIIKKKSAARKLSILARNVEKVSRDGLDNLSGKIDEVMRQLIEIKEKAEGKKRGVTEQVKDWVVTSSGLFLTSEVHRDLCLTSRDLKKQANEAIRRLAEEGAITPCGDKRGCYRKVEDSEEIDWLGADIDNVYPIMWPFQLERLVTIYPGNIVVIAGAKSAGKSAFLYNLIKLNQKTHKINYYNSESGKEEMKLRLSKFEDMKLTDWRFKAYARSSNFPEVIHPDRLNIIDYYEMTDKFYLIAGEIRQIHERLKKGICVIAIQKDDNADLGRGKDFSREKARLYMTMGKGKLKIIDGKIWASDQNPEGTEIDYKLVGGAKFIEVGGSRWNLS